MSERAGGKEPVPSPFCVGKRNAAKMPEAAVRWPSNVLMLDLRSLAK